MLRHSLRRRTAENKPEWAWPEDSCDHSSNSSRAYMYADSKVEGLLHSEQLALYRHLRQVYHALTEVVYGHKASEKEAPAPRLQEQDALQQQITNHKSQRRHLKAVTANLQL